MKKTLFSLAAGALLLTAGLAKIDTYAAGSGKPLRIVTTIFPEYDWVRQILGEEADHAELTMLLDNGVDLHSFQPTVQDIVKISTCDLFLYIGGESDAWVEDALKEVTNPDQIVINLLETLGDRAREEETVEGMQEEEESVSAEDEAEAPNDDEEEEVEYDEHVWLSLKNAAFFCGEIEKALETIDPDHAEIYAANAAAYEEQLSALDVDYLAAVDAAPLDTVLFGDRFPFRYLTEDYGLNYYAAFSGCSAETEASFETIIFLSGKTDELGLPAILAIEGSDHRIAETIRGNTVAKDQEILILDSMQSTTSADVENGASYLSIMENNLEVLREALG